MLKTIDLIKDIDEKYIPMLKMVNIPDFYKCIAQFSGLSMNEVNDEVMKNYLLTWAKNKYRFFKLLNNQLRVDTPLEYNRMRDDILNEVININEKFPVFAPWLDGFKRVKENKIKDIWDIDNSVRINIDRYFPSYKLMGSTITHFFKSCLNAPDELITAIAAIFENQKIKATYTISIDPIDMMLASENPYNWTSCYRLELDRDDSHADGCLAAILDTTSLITYVWNNKGKFDLYEKYHFKEIRYKRMREWIAISENMTSIHFNEIYPGKDYDEDFEKSLRDVVETMVANHIDVKNKWKKDAMCICEREFGYGYSEYGNYRVWTQVDNVKESYSANRIPVFDVEIQCPCGCGSFLPGSYSDDEDVEYDGQGFIAENFNNRYWCDLADDYCDCGCEECCKEECENCYHWKQAHPVCDLDTDYECENPDYDNIDNDGIVSHCAWSCKDCPKYKEHFPEGEKEYEDDDDDEEEEEGNTKIQTLKIDKAFDDSILASYEQSLANYQVFCRGTINPSIIWTGGHISGD